MLSNHAPELPNEADGIGVAASVYMLREMPRPKRPVKADRWVARRSTPRPIREFLDSLTLMSMNRSERSAFIHELSTPRKSANQSYSKQRVVQHRFEENKETLKLFKDLFTKIKNRLGLICALLNHVEGLRDHSSLCDSGEKVSRQTKQALMLQYFEILHIK